MWSRLFRNALVATSLSAACLPAHAESGWLSLDQARAMSQPALTDTVLSFVGQQVVEARVGAWSEGSPEEGGESIGIDLAFQPVPAGAGVCAATLLTINLEGGRYSSLAARTVYKVIGPADPNGDTANTATCAGRTAIATTFFSAAGGEDDIRRAVPVLQNLSAASPQRIQCAEKSECAELGRLLPELSVDKIISIEPGSCRAECYVVAVWGGANDQQWARDLTVQVSSRDTGRKGWSVPVLQHLLVGAPRRFPTKPNAGPGPQESGR